MPWFPKAAVASLFASSIIMSAPHPDRAGEEIITPVFTHGCSWIVGHLWSRWVLLAGVAAGLTSCGTLSTMAPPVEQLAAGSRGPAGALALGRDLYIGRCAKCHSVEPVLKYTAAEWAVIIPDMAERTKLNAAEEAALKDYVDAVLKLGTPALKLKENSQS
jgi:hypothetical protein